MPFVTVDGQPLHYIDQGTGPAVLQAGSYLWDQTMWAPQIAALSQHYRVIALELWGHGESGRMPECTHSLDDIAPERLRESIVPMGRITFGRDDLLPRLAELNPDTTLLMCGDQDKPRPPSETREMAELIGCPYLLVPEAGHISNLENPEFVM